MDLDELLRKVRSGDINELTLKDVTLPDGTRIAQAQLDNPADAVMFGDLMVRSRQTEPTEVMAARVAKRRQTGGKAIYIHGLSPVGASNDTISGPGAVAVSASVIEGRIEGIQDNKAIVGWAYSAGLRRSIDVHMYAGGAYGTGTLAAIASANLASEPGVASACSSSGSNYRFSIPITEDLIRSQGGKPFYIHGISPVGRDNSLIDGSGALSIPAMQRNAAFVSQNMPAQLPTGRSVTGSVRFTNTGNVTWRQGQGYRAVLVGDTRGWSPGEVGLPSDVPPGGSVDFNFSLRAPLGAGGYNLRWRMRDGAGDFGNESSNQVVQVVAPPPVEHGVCLAARRCVYDANQQLCKVMEPESGLDRHGLRRGWQSGMVGQRPVGNLSAAGMIAASPKRCATRARRLTAAEDTACRCYIQDIQLLRRVVGHPPSPRRASHTSSALRIEQVARGQID